ncbi:MAG: DUF2797 domain-containing protein [Deltaproteobacteria bacterium]|jgi:hypothetical protein|nr:DUF2797 domain-containing protein [Deltaproteobacteria bacterium]MBW2531640.1 DUF2797 domain-containing protein [Deltaproteobacteria bacterium]
MPTRSRLRKMLSEHAEPVRYHLRREEGEPLALNPWLGQRLQVRFGGTIHCVLCGRRTNKSFGDGLCYPCFRDAPQASPCIIRPELCEGHLGKGRDPAWEQEHHVQPHVVYLAVTSGLKVGVTRDTEIPTRWIDQGAHRAVVLARVPRRQLAGQIEVALKSHVSDRTQWQTMLKNAQPTDIDLAAERDRLADLLPSELQQYRHAEDSVVELSYPVRAYPPKVKSINLAKTPEFEGTLWGIKGQYLLLRDGRVFNVRKHSGYDVELDSLEPVS